MEEKTTGESSDSEVYLSADEGLSSSRGSEKAEALPRSVSNIPPRNVRVVFYVCVLCFYTFN